MISIDEVLNKLYKETRPKCREDYYRSLYYYASMIPDNSLIVEIGCLFGHSAMCMAAAIHGTNKRILTIDPGYKIGEFKYASSSRDSVHNFHHDAKRLLNDFYMIGVQEYITVIPELSFEYLKKWDEKRKIDLLFIDGDHSSDGVTEDVQWLQHVRNGGYAAFDDWMESVKNPTFKYLEDHKEWKILHESTSPPEGEMCVTLMKKG